MRLIDDVKATLPGWHITEASGLVDADLGPVNVQFHAIGENVVARVFVGVRAVAGGLGTTVDLAMAGLRAELGEIGQGCSVALNALGGGA